MITIGITTAPRDKPYLSKTLNCLIGQEFQVFAEPGSHVPNGINHQQKKGLLKNWDFALKWLIENSKTDLIAIFQDDIILQNFNMAVEQLPNDFGFASLYTPVNHKNICKKDGWNLGRIGWGMTGACALIFNKKSAKALLTNYHYNHHLDNYGKDQQLDAIIGTCMMKMKMNCYWYSPSLVEHIGIHSTTGHRHDERISAPVK